MNYSQGWVFPADINDPPRNWPTFYQDAYPRTSIPWTSIECQNTSYSLSEDLEVHSLSFAESSSAAKPASEEASFNIVFEDPTHPRTYREKRVRSREDIAKQKHDSRLLKTSGGACIWCYRSKKKCDPTHICHPCSSNGRKCIRDPAQLSLLVPAMISSNNSSIEPPFPFFHETFAALYPLGARAFQKADSLSVVVNIRQSPRGDSHTWAMDLTSADLTLPMTAKAALEQFLAKAIMCVQCTQLSTLEEAYCSHPLVHKALKIAKLFLAISCLAKTCAHAHSDDLDAARLTILLALFTGSQNLAEMSQSFSVELYDALRRKDLQDSYCHDKYRPRTKSPLHPLWVACALYYRVIGGLLDLEPNSPIARIFRSLEPHLECVYSTMWGVVICVSSSPQQTNKRKTKQILRNLIPTLSSTRFFDLSFSTSIGDRGDGLPSPMMPGWQSDPFCELGYDPDSLINADLMRPVIFPNQPSVSQDSLKSSSTEPQVEPFVSDNISMSETSDSSAIDPDLLNDIFDPAVRTRLEMMVSIESVWQEVNRDDLNYCFFDNTQ